MSNDNKLLKRGEFWHVIVAKKRNVLIGCLKYQFKYIISNFRFCFVKIDRKSYNFECDL